MKREVEEPKVTPYGDGYTRATHPAFGGIVAHRVSGNRSLYGSDFVHKHFMRVTITTSEYLRGLSHDSYHGSLRPLIEVDMTEAQWAEFISAPNIGTGVPCTIDNFNGQMMPLLPDPDDKREVFTNEARQTLQNSLRELEEIKRMLDTTPGISRAAAAKIAKRIETAESQLGPSLDYVARTFAKHIETTVSKARQEIHGHMIRQLTRAGAAATDVPLAIDVDETHTEPARQIDAKPDKFRFVKKKSQD